MLAATAPARAATEAVSHYELQVAIDPASRSLDSQVRLEVPEASAGRPVEFLLASTLEIVAAEPSVERLPAAGVRAFTGINGSAAAITASGRAARYRVVLPPGSRSLRLHYRGKVDFGFDTPGQEYARGFSETAGVINEQGVYLAGSTLWYPYLGETLFTFELAASAPAGWRLISPGSGTSAGSDARWKATTPVDELHIVGGPLTRYARQAGAVSAEVYLRKPDEALAAKYLEATARNLEMYRTLIGPYPYDKFALVENFWETGYGMPSFTLLGPQIIRFPFILTSSYPHEILHNWWGNGVFVDYSGGNWCEGLTAYHADHLYKEQLGQGAEYRRDTLKKYRDFVKEARDFPLVEFRSRHSPATEAVGYGKALMTYHMLRRRVGDEAYIRGLQRFYREQRGKRAGFADLARAHGAAAKQDLGAFMTQWVTRAGAPELQLAGVAVAADGSVRGELRQVQKGEPFDIEVPVVLRTANGLESFAVRSTAASTRFELRPTAAVLGLEVDPEFDLFRLLDARETAPSLGQMFGEPEVLAVLPARASPQMLEAYRNMLAFWGGGGAQKFVIIEDRALRELPADRPVWVFGRENLWAAKLFASDSSIGLQVDANGIVANGTQVPFADHSLVVVRRHPGAVAKAVGWIVIDPLAAAEGLARKLPHYGKYSWLGFAGTEPANVAKGEWPAADSPLHLDLRAAAARTGPLASGGYARRAPLARLPAVFDGAAMLRDIGWLADPAREGRGMGSAGLDAAADYVAAAFGAAKLKTVAEAFTATAQIASAGSEGYFQPFAFTPQGAQQPLRLRNVIGVLPGSDPRFAGEAVIVSAHYDHLGRSGPGVRMSEVGQVHPGADDNASGVAVLLELARVFAAAGPPPRTLVFVAFAGEEAGLQGSKYFVTQPPVPLTGIRSVLNLDTVGRLGTGEISALATGTASEWQHVFRGITFSTGIPVRSIPGASQSSDQQSFIDRGIPGVQLFTSAHLDYHRPTDTADRIDGDGLVKVATVAREALDYLVQRPAPLTVTIDASMTTIPVAGSAASTGGAVAAAAATPARRVSFGLVPDYAHQGAGVRAESVVPDSPAARAGIAAGDVLLELDGKAVTGLAEFAEMLKAHGPGDSVRALVIRAGARRTVSVELTAR